MYIIDKLYFRNVRYFIKKPRAFTANNAFHSSRSSILFRRFAIPDHSKSRFTLSGHPVSQGVTSASSQPGPVLLLLLCWPNPVCSSHSRTTGLFVVLRKTLSPALLPTSLGFRYFSVGILVLCRPPRMISFSDDTVFLSVDLVQAVHRYVNIGLIIVVQKQTAVGPSRKQF